MPEVTGIYLAWIECTACFDGLLCRLSMVTDDEFLGMKAIDHGISLPEAMDDSVFVMLHRASRKSSPCREICRMLCPRSHGMAERGCWKRPRSSALKTSWQTTSCEFFE